MSDDLPEDEKAIRLGDWLEEELREYFKSNLSHSPTELRSEGFPSFKELKRRGAEERRERGRLLIVFAYFIENIMEDIEHD
jgi:hypothetical protein